MDLSLSVKKCRTEVDTGNDHKDDGNGFDGTGIEVSDAGVMC